MEGERAVRQRVGHHEEQLHQRARTGDREAIGTLAERYDGLARSLARRFSGRGDGEDVLQVARCALVGALRRFDTEVGASFSTYAYATILGELKKASRATRWTVHVPRQVQEAYLDVTRAEDEALRELARTPSTAELSVAVRRPEVEVAAVRSLGRLLTAAPLEEGAEHERSRRIAVDEVGFRRVEHRALIENTLQQLAPMHRRVLQLRFLAGMSQREVGALLGMSQRQVARLQFVAIARARSVTTGAEY